MAAFTDLQPYEDYPDQAVPTVVRDAQRVMLLYLSKGDEIWIAVAKSIGLDPALDCSFADEQQCLRIGMRWMQDPEIERLTESIQRLATAQMRILRLRAAQVMGKFLDSPRDQVSYRAARDIIKTTDPDLERLRLAAGGRSDGGQHRALKQSDEGERQRLRERAKRNMERVK